MKKLSHVAFIPDGNRRWAKEHGLPTLEGHRRGFEAVRKAGEYLRSVGVTTFTVWAFSTENWSRSRSEIEYLMTMFGKWIAINLKTALKDQMRIIHFGRKERLSSSLKKIIQQAEEKTAQCSKFYLGIALDYGGRDELLRAVQKLQNSKSVIQTEKDFEQFLDTSGLPNPNPDLIIRTSGEQRTSGFLPWQSAYAEYIFEKKYLPDFTVEDMKRCVEEYSKRQRRFGK